MYIYPYIYFYNPKVLLGLMGPMGPICPTTPLGLIEKYGVFVFVYLHCNPAISRHASFLLSDKFPTYASRRETYCQGRYGRNKHQNESTSSRPESNGIYPGPGFGPKSGKTGNQMLFCLPEHDFLKNYLFGPKDGPMAFGRAAFAVHMHHHRVQSCDQLGCAGKR